MWVDLTQEFYEDMPHSVVHPSPSIDTFSAVETDGINVTEFTAVTHVGTHIDVPLHFVPDGETIDTLPLEQFAGTGVVIDVTKTEPEAVTVEDVEVAPVTVRENDIVLLYTGWCHKYGDADYDPHPWLTADLAEWFVERGVKLVGVDTITPDIPSPHRPEGWMEYPVHRTLLENGVLIAEHLGNLDSVADERLDIYGFPIKFRDGDGAQARFVGRR